MPPEANSNPRPGAVDLALTEEQREAFFAHLRTVPALTGERIKEELKRMYGIEVGLNAAYTFKNGSFDSYLAKLRARAIKKTLIKEAQGDPLDGTSDAETASFDVAEAIQEFTSSGMLDTIDLTEPEGVKQMANLSLIIKRLRGDDRAIIALKAQMEDRDRKLLESEAKRAAAIAAVDQLTKPAAAGLTVAARNTLRAELGMPLLLEEAA